MGADPTAQLRAETVVEELLTNSVVHGHAGDPGPASIWLAVTASGEALRLRYEDGYGAFDPMPIINEALARTSNPMDQRPVGGLGLLLVYRLADEFHYVRENGRNCIDLLFLGRRGT